MGHRLRVLQLANSDLTIAKLLLPLIDRMEAEGYDVSAACAAGPHATDLVERGYVVHTVPITRTVSPWSTIRATWALYRLMRRERFDIVHVHTPIAAAIGRVAAKLARVPVVVYTAHGFYFHERMSPRARRLVVGVERLLGRITSVLFTQNHEDAVSAVEERIAPRDRVVWIGNGVDTERLRPGNGAPGGRRSLGVADDEIVVGFVGRLVQEKGIIELLSAMKVASANVPNLVLMIVGDNKAGGDRDRKTFDRVREYLDQNDLRYRVLFTGFLEDIARVMQVMDVFVLPSYREGMPRTIIEAMACGKPVVATDIRGCREEVVHGQTGLLVPVADVPSLARAITQIVSQPQMAQAMGALGRKRAEAVYNEQLVLDREMTAFRELMGERTPAVPMAVEESMARRAIDVTASGVSLLLLAVPFLAIALLIKLSSPGPVFFRQERVGKDGQLFNIWKFRTMVDGAVNMGLGLNTSADDARITRVGRFLRALSLDELPQLINVFRGEMSLIGPRPTFLYQVEQYDEEQLHRLDIRPGITSWASVCGRNRLSWEERIKMDVWYVRNRSLWLDLKILARTAWVAFVTREGIYGAGGANDDFVRLAEPRNE